MAKSKKKTKLSRFGKLTRVLNVSSTRGKMLVFLLLFALVGGGYMTYQTFAAVAPPSTMTNIRDIGIITAADGVKARLLCATVTGDTGYGPLARYVKTSCKLIFSKVQIQEDDFSKILLK